MYQSSECKKLNIIDLHMKKSWIVSLCFKRFYRVSQCGTRSPPGSFRSLPFIILKQSLYHAKKLKPKNFSKHRILLGVLQLSQLMKISVKSNQRCFLFFGTYFFAPNIPGPAQLHGQSKMIRMRWHPPKVPKKNLFML